MEGQAPACPRFTMNSKPPQAVWARRSVPLQEKPIAAATAFLITSGMNMELGKAAGCLLLLCVCLGGQAESQELKIGRKERVVSYLQDGDQILKRWIKVGDDLYRGQFKVPSSFLMIGSNDNVDPFADNHEKPKTKTAKEVLEDAGVTFDKGTEASYNKKTRF